MGDNIGAVYQPTSTDFSKALTGFALPKAAGSVYDHIREMLAVVNELEEAIDNHRGVVAPVLMSESPNQAVKGRTTAPTATPLASEIEGATSRLSNVLYALRELTGRVHLQ